VVTPDDICNEYGADTCVCMKCFRTIGTSETLEHSRNFGSFGFLKNYGLYFDDNGLIVTNDAPTKDNLKSLHKTIKKVAEDIEGFFQYFGFSVYDLCE
jgi:leucyl-tRNA synthetase